MCVPPTPHSRFAINVPAAVGVAAVFVVAVAAWVVASRVGGDEVSNPDRTIPPASLVSTPSTVPESTAPRDSTLPPQTTSPIPLPTNVPKAGRATTTIPSAKPANPDAKPAAPATTVAPPAKKKTTTTTAAPKVEQEGSGGGKSGGPGDLGIKGHPIQQPTCDGAFVTIIASVVGSGDAVAQSVEKQLEDHPDANYLRTDTSCSSFRQDVEGEPIYVVYLGPFAQPEDACQARSSSSSPSYVKRLTNGDDAGPGCTDG